MPQSCEPKEAQIFRFEPRMDTAACTQMEEALQALLDEVDSPVVFDCVGVKFVSSAFLGLCVRVYKKASVHGFEVINVEPAIKRVFKISGLEDVLQVR